MRLELAADYLVMAAWLAFLKSKLLLPEQRDEDEPTGEELAAALAFRLRRLEAMREVSEKLMNRSRQGREVFHRGAPETMSVQHKSIWDASIFVLLSAYATQRQRQSVTSVRVLKRTVWSLQDAMDMIDLSNLPQAQDFTVLLTLTSYPFRIVHASDALRKQSLLGAPLSDCICSNAGISHEQLELKPSIPTQCGLCHDSSHVVEAKLIPVLALGNGSSLVYYAIVLQELSKSNSIRPGTPISWSSP